MAIYAVGTFTSFIPLDNPAPTAWVASDTWKTAAYSINTADNDNTDSFWLKARDSKFLKKIKHIAQKVPYNNALNKVLFPIWDISFQLFLPQALLTLMEPPCANPHETINATVADRKSTRLNSSHLVISYA